MKVRIDVLLKVSMARQVVREAGEHLARAEIIEGWLGTAEELREAIDSGALLERLMQELIGAEQLAEVREALQSESQQPKCAPHGVYGNNCGYYEPMDGSECLHPSVESRPILGEDAKGPSPPWCPLRGGSG